MKHVLWTLLGCAAAAAAGAFAVVRLGLYDIAANEPHWQPVHDLLETTMHASVRLRARGIDVPPLDDPHLLDRGAACYRDHCTACHGGPGQAAAPFARSMQPLPGPLVDAATRWRPAELYWITRHGIKMSGMPAWQERLTDADLWAVAAFVERLGRLGTADFRDWMSRLPADGCAMRDLAPVPAVADAARGRTLFAQYGCNGCHVIPGVTGSRTLVGPPLDGFGRRALIAGRVDNTTEQLAAWLRDPGAVDPDTAMPNMGVSERDARDMAAWLGRLK